MVFKRGGENEAAEQAGAEFTHKACREFPSKIDFLF